MPDTLVADLAAAVRERGPGQRRALAKAITLLESTLPADRSRAEALLAELLPASGQSLRVGISGVPGVGKSTLIEALGMRLVGQGHRVAVLAVDPSSSVSGGSILGDKTRMERLAASEQAFVRPSPSAGLLGGVAQATREAVRVCEAAGHDVVIVETVGVGQSEAAVAGMTDAFVLMQLPNAGDDLQAIKRGVMELADLVVINKADLDEAAAARACAHISAAMHARAAAAAPVMPVSALTGAGLDTFWAALTGWAEARRGDGRFVQRRERQNESWMWECIQAGLQRRFRLEPAVQALLPGVARQVREGTLSAGAAAQLLLDALA